MPKRLLAIGVGGSGKASLTILKERLEETYGRVPDNVVLLSIDTDDLRKQDVFAGTQLTPVVDERGRESEYLHVVSPAGMTMDTVFADIVNGRTTAYMDWLEHVKLDKILGPGERDIRGGAQQRRPVGRVALVLSWANIYNSIVAAIQRMYGDPEEEQPVDAKELEKSKRQVFIVGSVAGGTGSGFMIDIANLVRYAVWSNSNWRSVDVSGVIVLPDAFQSYTTLMDDPTNLKPNSYAALRELDRFVRTHGANLPYMIRYGQDLRSTTWSTNQPLDHVYLVDTASRAATGEQDLAGDPMRGVFPVVADFIMAHVDNSLGNALATLRSNAGQHYSKEDGWQYSGFNIKTYIFPVDDVIESFSYRFLREMFTRQYLPLQDKKMQAQTEMEAGKATISIFSQGSVGGKVNPALVQKAIASTRPVDPERPNVSWQGLFNMIALSEGSFAEDLQDTEGWLVYLRGNLQPSKQGEYKNEGFDEGYVRLMNFSDNFLDEVLGPQIDPDDEESRTGGEWDKILARYRDALRQRFSEALDAGLLEVLNARDPNSKILLPARLPYARAMTATLKKTLVQFKVVLQNEYRKENIDTRIRNTSTELRNAIAAMQQTRDARGGLFGSRAVGDARKAQSSFIGLFCEKMELSLHQRVYRTVIDVIDALGAEEKDRDGVESTVDVAALELENWQATMQEVDKLLAGRSREHEVNREAKRRVRVRRYLTDAEYEKQLYADPRHSGTAGTRVLGQVRGDKGMTWERKEPTEPLQFKMVTAWTEEASGPEEIADRFFQGMKDLFQVVRENVSVGDRVAAEFKSPASFVNKVNEVSDPFLRYNPALNGKQMFSERYVSFNLKSANEQSQKMLSSADATLASQREGYSVDTEAESLVACTVVQVARGAKLTAIDQFSACETDYRGKLYRGRESLHLFTEEQVATDYEGRIEILGEPDNKQRPLAPDLVITMGDEAKLKVFTLACAYGMVEAGSHWDPDTGLERTEVFLNIGGDRRMPLSRSQTVQGQDPRFAEVSADEQINRLYLNSLQNFVLLATEKRGVPSGLVASLVDDLRRRAVALDHIENPFTLSVRQVNTAMREVMMAVGPTESEEPDQRRREAINAKRRVDRYLQPFVRGRVASFKRSPAIRVRDMGTVMHLILNSEINTLLERALGGNG